MISGFWNIILSYGERVDGSSLFAFIEAGSSDMYVIPRYRTAFLNPFSEVPTSIFYALLQQRWRSNERLTGKCFAKSSPVV